MIRHREYETIASTFRHFPKTSFRLYKARKAWRISQRQNLYRMTSIGSKGKLVASRRVVNSCCPFQHA